MIFKLQVENLCEISQYPGQRNYQQESANQEFKQFCWLKSGT